MGGSAAGRGGRPTPRRLPLYRRRRRCFHPPATAPRRGSARRGAGAGPCARQQLGCLLAAKSDQSAGGSAPITPHVTWCEPGGGGVSGPCNPSWLVMRSSCTLAREWGVGELFIEGYTPGGWRGNVTVAVAFRDEPPMTSCPPAAAAVVLSLHVAAATAATDRDSRCATDGTAEGGGRGGRERSVVLTKRAGARPPVGKAPVAEPLRLGRGWLPVTTATAVAVSRPSECSAAEASWWGRGFCPLTWLWSFPPPTYVN